MRASAKISFGPQGVQKPILVVGGKNLVYEKNLQIFGYWVIACWAGSGGVLP